MVIIPPIKMVMTGGWFMALFLSHIHAEHFEPPCLGDTEMSTDPLNWTVVYAQVLVDK